MNILLTKLRLNGPAATTLMLAFLAAIPSAGVAQTPVPLEPYVPLDVTHKFYFHAKRTVGPTAILGVAAYAAILQEANAPEEWKQGGAAYGKRVGSMVAWAGIHSALAFGLDSTLHQDPRYFRSTGTGFWRRSGGRLFRSTRSASSRRSRWASSGIWRSSSVLR